VTSKEVDGIELQLAMQCAPLIAGLKISNLLKIRRDEFESMKAILESGIISWYVIRENGGMMTVLLFHAESLESYLSQGESVEILKKAGYKSVSLDCVLAEFSRRYKYYMEARNEFPHEIGLLLGYPIEDVKGFIAHRGDNSLCGGYWKVYAHKEKKLKLFDMFERAKESMIRLLYCGVSMEDIIDTYCDFAGIGLYI
jgi:hypothetical protein